MVKEKEEYEFQMPSFDEKEFITEQKKKAKSAFISFGFGILMGIICSAIWISLGDSSVKWPVTFLLGICSLGFLIKIFQLFKIDVSTFERKDWLGTGAFYFFTFLAFFIISINPPFYDGSPPVIDTFSLPSAQEVEGNTVLVAKITDNVGLKSTTLEILTPDGKTFNESLINEGNDIYFYDFKNKENTTGVFTFLIRSEDTNGNQATKNGTFSFTEDIISISDYQQGQSLSRLDEIKIRVKQLGIDSNNMRVFYTVNNGEEINASYSGEDTYASEYIYTTSPDRLGWSTGFVTVEVFVEVVHYFVLPKDVNQTLRTSHGRIIDNQNYSFFVDSIGSLPSPNIDLPQPQTLQRVPGFGVVSLVIAVALLSVLKRKRKL
jgi:hypothetical protein